jgi:hypothetical protein
VRSRRRAARPRPGAGFEVVERHDGSFDVLLDGRAFSRGEESAEEAYGLIDRRTRSRRPVDATLVLADGTREPRRV